MNVDPWITHIYKYCRRITYSRADEDHRDLAHNVILKLLNVDEDKIVNDAYIHSICANTWRDMVTTKAVHMVHINNMNVDNIVPMALMVFPDAEVNIEAKQKGISLDDWADAKEFISSIKRRLNARRSSKKSYTDPVKRELKKKAALEYYYKKKGLIHA